MLKQQCRGKKRERERAVSACGLKMEQKRYPECPEKIENKVRQDTQLELWSKGGSVTH